MSFDLRTSKTGRPEKKDFNESSEREFFENVRKNDHSEIPQEEEPGSSGGIGDILHSWRAAEFEVYEKSGRWYIIAALFILALVAYALLTNSPIMAITFILLGIVGFIYSQKPPRSVTFAITTKGVLADKELYLYENIFSFWIFYEPMHTKTISLHTKASMLPFVHIPLGKEDPVALREMLLQNIDEIKQDPSLIDTLERVLHI
jgi:hypothetical protein